MKRFTNFFNSLSQSDLLVLGIQPCISDLALSKVNNGFQCSFNLVLNGEKYSEASDWIANEEDLKLLIAVKYKSSRNYTMVRMQNLMNKVQSFICDQNQKRTVICITDLK